MNEYRATITIGFAVPEDCKATANQMLDCVTDSIQRILRISGMPEVSVDIELDKIDVDNLVKNRVENSENGA